MVLAQQGAEVLQNHVIDLAHVESCGLVVVVQHGEGDRAHSHSPRGSSGLPLDIRRYHIIDNHFDARLQEAAGLHFQGWVIAIRKKFNYQIHYQLFLY